MNADLRQAGRGIPRPGPSHPEKVRMNADLRQAGRGIPRPGPSHPEKVRMNIDPTSEQVAHPSRRSYRRKSA